MLPNQLAPTFNCCRSAIDPLRTDPKALSAWLKRFAARPGWIAASPRSQLWQVTALSAAD